MRTHDVMHVYLKNGEVREYLTNNLSYTMEQVDEIYRARWQIEVFFKWIKQNLKIKTFLGTSENAVLAQMWVAMIYYLLLAYIKFQTKFAHSLLEFTRMVRETLLVRRPLIDLLSLTARTVRRVHDPTVVQLSLL
jgi:IS4 transposase